MKYLPQTNVGMMFKKVLDHVAKGIGIYNTNKFIPKRRIKVELIQQRDSHTNSLMLFTK